MNNHRRALVIGGGIAGPATALFLARQGIEPLVFEAYPRTDDVGGGLQIAPNGLRVLTALGLREPLLKVGHACHDMAFRNHQGRDIGLVRTAKAGPSLNIARGAIHCVLRDELDRQGIGVRFDKRLVGIDAAGGGVVASFADGTTARGDFLIGADGVHSRVRAWMLPDARPRDTEMISIGGLCAPGAVAPPDPRDAGRLTFVVGPVHQFGYALMGGQWGWWCHAHGASEAERRALLTIPWDDLGARMLERYRGWAEPVEPLIRGSAWWLRTRIHDVPTLPAWHRGPVLLLGDAAHAMSPAGGQGASLALEDAQVFASLVADPARPVEEAMARFESLRRSRAEAMVAQAYANDRRSLQQLGAVGRWTRDHLLMPVFARFIERALAQVYTAPLGA